MPRSATSNLLPRLIAVVVLTFATSGCGRTIDERGDPGAGGGAADPGEDDVARWAAPPCDPVATIDGVAFHDTAQEAYAIVPLDDPNVLLAHTYGTLTRSVDAGCTWSRFPGEEPAVGTGFDAVTARAGGGAYATLGEELVLLEGDLITRLPGPAIQDEWGGRSMRLVAVHATDPDQLVVRAEEELFRSFDGGHTWAPAVRLPVVSWPHVVFDPRDLDHVLVSDETGLSVTWDAGASWTRAMVEAAGQLSPAPRLDVRHPAGEVVHADEHLDPGEDPARAPRRFRSEDGGATFTEVARPHGRDHVMPDGRVWRTRKLPGGDIDTWPGIEIIRVVDGVEEARVEIPIERAETELVTAPNGVLYLHRGSSAM